ncbi:helix-turn-helix domain-containing protein [Candidatus Colwellia aromaticivorans]|uniref:helix-turn-helix domain-containing protein n=1 Tax=Candidatus Colwellia aromaticivorans TaxID=2267621 RepID=UPI000DF49C72|nr:LysR family transcriptional regulator [Candidatus Colwellia aromaticivorans]
MSEMLKRLRETFDDELFYRTSDGLIPSEKAKQIGKILPDIFDELNGVIRAIDLSRLNFRQKKTDSRTIGGLAMRRAIIFNYYKKCSYKGNKRIIEYIL